MVILVVHYSFNIDREVSVGLSKSSKHIRAYIQNASSFAVHDEEYAREHRDGGKDAFNCIVINKHLQHC